MFEQVAFIAIAPLQCLKGYCQWIGMIIRSHKLLECKAKNERGIPLKENNHLDSCRGGGREGRYGEGE